MPKYKDVEKLEPFLRRDEWGTPDERWRPESEFGALIDALPEVDLKEVLSSATSEGES